MENQKITKDTLIAKVLEINAEKAAPLFFELGMHCLGCAAAHGETIEQACEVHDEDPEKLVNDLNNAIFPA